MPKLSRAGEDTELKQLIALFLQAETDIINEMGRLRSLGLVDYHAVAALERVQRILKQLETDCWQYVPKMVERQFYVRVPEARKILEPVEKHLTGYKNAAALTGEQHAIVDLLTMNLMGEIVEAENTVLTRLQEALLGRTEPDIYRSTGLGAVAAMQASGRSTAQTVPVLVERLQAAGVTAFVDRAGRRWSLSTYGAMVCRTTSRQAEVLAALTADEGQDLYQISSHGTTCPLCAPYEGRVYSKSGKDPDFPPLAMAFGKVDPDGPDELSNTYLNIHPNCWHVILPWTPAGRTPEEIQKIKDFSNPKKNPFTVDPRTKQQVEAYRKKERSRAKWLADYRQWEQYRLALGDEIPKTFQTWQRHKLAGDEKYQSWREKYQQRNRLDEAQEYALMRYVSSESYLLNETLRNGWNLTNEQEKWIINLDAALEKMPKYQGDLTRSVDFFSAEQAEAFADRYQVGEIITEKQYLSTTKGETYQPNAKVQLYIVNSTQGYDLGKFNRGENEILYKRNAKFKVLNKKQQDGVYYILLEEA